MNSVLGDLKNFVAFPYLDDIIIPSKTIEEGMIRLRQVLEALRKHRITLKLEKCSFFAQSIEYLGRDQRVWSATGSTQSRGGEHASI